MVDGELHADQHRGAEGGDRDVVSAARPEGHQHRQAHDRALTTVCSQPSEWACPQMLKGESRPPCSPIVRCQKVERPGS